MPFDHLKSKALRYCNKALQLAGVRLERVSRHRSVMDFVAARDIDLVVDVGANQGQFGMSLREAGYTGLIHSFEPVASAFAVLTETAKRSPPWEVFNIGLSNVGGQAVINVAKYSVFSSLSESTVFAPTFDKDSAVVARETIVLRTLDEVLRDMRPSRSFLKIDTQGHERAVLEGAERSLETFRGVVMEIPVRHLYQNVWRIEDAIAFMRTRGFTVSNMIPTNFDTSLDLVSLVELDCVFKNERFST